MAAPNPFQRTLRSIERDRYTRSRLTLLLVLLTLSVWVGWFFVGEVTVREVSTRARIEGRLHAIEMPVAGTVTVAALQLAAHVDAGDVLVRLRDEPIRIELRRKRLEIQAIEAQLEPLRAEMDEVEAAFEVADRTGKIVSLELLAEARAARAASDHASLVTENLEDLAIQGFASGSELERERANAKSLAQQARASSLRRQRTKLEKEELLIRERAQFQSLRKEVASLRGQIASEKQVIESLEHDLRRSVLWATTPGQLTDVEPIVEGTVLAAAEPVATLVEDGSLRGVAYFPPGVAVGRIETGHKAVFKLEAFPWTEYGTVPAHVVAVAREVRDGLVRVELELDEPDGSSIPLQHGLVGTVEVEIEHVPPVTLVIRALGLVSVGE